jgi:hypothetical protein
VLAFQEPCPTAYGDSEANEEVDENDDENLPVGKKALPASLLSCGPSKANSMTSRSERTERRPERITGI